jgi:hypothetical protein
MKQLRRRIQTAMQQGGGAAAFSPLDIPGLKLWLDASQIVGLNDGDAVTTWSDLSGNGNHATQATASKKPTYKNTGGKVFVKFDGVDDFMTGALAAVAQPFTVALRVKQPNDGFSISSSGLAYFPYLRQYYFSGANLLSGAPFSAADYHTIVILVNGGSSSVRVDSVQVASGNMGSNGLSTYELGAWQAGTSFWSDQSLQQACIYAGLVTGANLTALEAYLNAVP